MHGRIIKGIAGFYYVQADDEKLYECKAKGAFRNEKKKPLVGDEVDIEILDEKELKGNIITLLPRKSELFRPAVANVDQIAVLFACREPDVNFNLLNRFLVVMESLNVPVILCFTKFDLTDEEFKEKIIGMYRAAKYPLCFISSKASCCENDLEHFKELLKGRVTALAGPSGVGKSTLVNQLFPEASMDTGALSEKIKRGRHTTRHSEIFYLGNQTFIFDTPGFSSLELMNMDKTELELMFPEFQPYLGQCRFTGCSHISEPSCMVKSAVSEGRISIERYNDYCTFYQDLSNIKKY